jgi:hypothetical protein
MCDDDGDKGSDSKKPRMKKKNTNPVNTNKGVAQKKAFGICCWKLEHSVKSISAAVPRSTNVRS